jgi:hypothetical protein
MGRRHVTADELLAWAEANGYTRGAYREADGVRGKEKTCREDEGSGSNTSTLRSLRVGISFILPLEYEVGPDIVPQMAS